MEGLEFKPWDEQAAYQIGQLNQLKEYLLKHSSFYKNKWNDAQLAQLDINSIADLMKFPCTTKEDIQLHESEFVCILSEDIREYNATSGTLGAPISIPLSANDLERLAYNEALSFEKMGIVKGEKVQLMLTLDRLFMAGMSYYGGLKKVGATIIRTGAGVPQLQWDAIFKYQPTTIVAVPSFLIKLVQYAIAHNIDYKSSSVKKVLAIGESVRDEHLAPNALHHKIKDLWDIAIFNTYAATEMQTGFTECTAHQGGHLHSDLLVVEILDEAGQQVAPGEVGEICITNLGVEALPLWRYKTGDMATLYTDACSCGRKSPRISGIVGRKNQMLKVKGTTIFPTAVFQALNAYLNVNGYVVEVYSNDLGQDVVRIFIDEQLQQGANYKATLCDYLRGKLKIVPDVEFVSEAILKQMQFPEISRKQIKFVDNRNCSKI